MNAKALHQQKQEVTRGYVSVGAAARYLGVSIDTIRRWERAGKLPAKRLDGKNRYFAVSQLKKFKSKQHLSTSEVAKRLGLSESTVRRLETQGRLVPIRDTSNKRLYREQDVINYLNGDSAVPSDVVGASLPSIGLEPRSRKAIDAVGSGAAGSALRTRNTLSEQIRREAFERAKDAIDAVENTASTVASIVVGDVERVAVLAENNRVRGSKGIGTYSLFAFISLACFLVIFGLLGLLWSRPTGQKAQQIVASQSSGANSGGSTSKGPKAAPLVLPKTFFIRIKDTGLSINVAAGKGGQWNATVDDNDYAKVPIDSAQIADAGVEFEDLSTDVQDMLTAAAQVSSGQSVTNQYTTQVVQGTNVIAGPGLSGSSDSSSLTLGLKVGSTTKLVANSLEVKLGGVVTSTTESASGLEASAQGIQLLGGCANGNVLRWSSVTNTWNCASLGGGGGGIDVQEDATVISPSAVAIQFTGSDFDITDNAGTGVVKLAGSGVAAGTYGSNTQVPTFHVDSKGRITSVASVAVSGITIGAGAGLAGGGTVNPSGSTALTIGAGTGIIVSADDVAVKVQPNKGIEADVNGLSLVDCVNNQLLKYNAGQWACAADSNTDAVASVFGRTGVVIAQLGDYSASQISNNSSVSGSYVSDALNTLKNANLGFGVGGNLTGSVSGTVGTGLTSTLDVKGNPTFSGLITGQSGLAITGNASVSGGLTASTLNGSGSGITGVNAAQLAGQVASYYLDLANATGTLSNSLLAGGGALTVSAGSGLSGGGSIALGGSASLNIGAGDGILVNANDVAINVEANKGLQVGPAGLALIDCSDGQVLKYGSGQWACGTDNIGSGGGGGAVGSVFGRTGVVIAQLGDYSASQITNNSTVTGSYVSDALNALKNASISFNGDGGNLTGGVSGSLGAGLSSTLAIKSNPTFSGLITGNSGLAITSGGANVTGTITATAFAGDGSSLSNVDASSLGGNAGSYYLDLANATGVLDVAQLSSDAITVDTTGDVNGNLTADSSVALGSTLHLSFSNTPTFADITLGSALSVANGGTGAGSFTTGGVLFGNGTGALQVTSAGSNGQLLVASGGQPVFVTASGDATIAANGAFTLSTIGGLTAGTYGNSTSVPQITVDSKGRITSVSNVSINTAPTGLAGGDLSGNYPNPTVNRVKGVNLDVTTGTAGNILIADGTDWVSKAISGDITISSAGVATIGTQAVTNSKLANSGISLNYGTNLSGDSSVVLGGTLDINFSNNPTFTGGLTVSGGTTSLVGGLNNNSGGITNTGAVSGVTTLATSGAINGLTLSNSGISSTGAFSIASAGAGNITLNSTGNIILSANGSLLNCGVSSGKLTTNASGVLQCATDQLGGGGGVVISGTSGRLAMFNSPDGDNVVDSDLQQLGGLLQLDTLDFNIESGDLQLGGTTVLTSSAALQNLTGIASSGTIAFTSLGSGVVKSTSGTLSAGSVALASEVSGMLGVANGGTGVNGSTAANGQLLVGNGAGYALTNLTQGAGVSVTNGAGSIAIAATLGSSVDSSEIVDGTISENDIDVATTGTAGLVLSSDGAGAFTWVPQTVDTDTDTTYIAGSGLALTGTTFNVGAGNCITVSANDIAVTDACVNAATLAGNGATFYQNASNINAGTLNVARLDSSVTLLGSTITKDELTNSGTLGFTWSNAEVADGLTIDGTGSVADGALSTNVTLLGNSFNSAGQLVQLDGSGNLPSLNGSALTNLAAGNVSGVVGVAHGGTGVDGSAATNGQLLVGNGSGYTLATLTQGAGVVVTNGAGSISIAATLGAAVDSSEIVDGTVAESDLNVSNTGSAGLVLSSNGAGAFTWVPQTVDTNTTYSAGNGLALTGTTFNVGAGSCITTNANDVAVTDACVNAATLGGNNAAFYQNATNLNAGTLDVARLDSSVTLLGSTITKNELTDSGTLGFSWSNAEVADGLTIDGTGSVADGALSANVTLLGNSFNGASQLVQLDASGDLPALDGSALTNLSAGSLSGVVGVANGGTGVSSFATGDLLYASSPTSLAGLAAVAAGSCLISNGVGAAPQWGSCSAGGGITGSGTTNTLPIFNSSGTLGNSKLSQNVAGTNLNVASGTNLNILGGDVSLTGALSVSGQVTLSGLGSAGIVRADGSGVLSTGNVALGTDTSGDYVGSLGSLTGLSTTGNSGEGSTPSLAVLYGSTAGTAVQGNTGVTISAGTGLSGGGSITLGSGGSLSVALANTTVAAGSYGSASAIPTFTVDAQGRLTAAGTTTLTNAALQNSSVTVAAGTGLSGGGSVALGGTTTLNVAYGSTANTAVQGNTTLTCPSGTGNLSGGGTSITLGAGGTCSALDTKAAVSFGTSVTTPTLTSTGALSVSSVGANDLTLTAGSGTAVLGATTLKTTDGLTLDMNKATDDTFAITNSGIGVAGISVEGSGAFGTGLTVASGGANITGGLTAAGTVTFGGLNSAGVVHTNGSGILSTSDVVLGSETSGNYLTSIGAVTGLTLGGTNGVEGGVPTLAVNYGSTANTAVQGNTALTVAAGTGLSGGATITLGSGGTAILNLADTTVTSGSYGSASSVATFTVDQQGRLTTAGTTAIGNLANGALQNSSLTIGAGTGLTGGGSVSLGGSTNLAVDFGAAAGQVVEGNKALTVTAGTGLSGGGTITLGSGGTTTLNVAYGSTANTAVQGNTTLTCPSGTGNLSGGGTSITLGAGGTCSALDTKAAVSFGTSVTTPTLTSTGALSVSSVGANDLTLTAGSGKLALGASTVQTTNDLTLDLTKATNTTLNLTNGGAGVAGLSVEGGANFGANLAVTAGGITVAGNSSITGTLTGLTGLTVASGGANITGGLTAAGTITFGGLNSAGVVHTNGSGTLSTGDVALGSETAGNYLSSLGSLTGLTLGGTNGVEGGVPTLAVNYGSSANQAAAGSNTFVCNSGTGNLSGGGGTVTLGTSGTNCGAISITNAPNFTTSVTTPTLTSGGALTVSSTGSNNLTLTSGSGTVTLNAGTIQRTAGLSFDLTSASATTFAITNSGAGVAGLTVEGGGSFGGNVAVTSGGLTITGNSTISGSLSGIAGLTIASGGITNSGGLNNASGGITNAGAVSGVTTLTTSSTINGQTISGAAVFTGTVDAASGFKYNGTAGETFSCGNNQYVNQAVVQGGIITSHSACSGVGLSDQRLKKDIVSLDASVLDSIKNVNAVSFNYDCSSTYFAESNTYCDPEHQTGVIAQQLAEVFPDLVNQDEYGYYHVDYQGLSVYSLKAVSEIAQHLDSEGNADLKGLTVNADTLLDGGLTVNGTAHFNGASAFDGTVAFGDAVTFNGPVTFNGQTHFSSNTGGYATISAGQNTVHVNFETAYATPPIVSATLGNGVFAQYSTNNVTATGFDIVLSQPATTNLDFSWLALSVKNPLTSLH